MAINMAGQHNQFPPHHYVELGIAFKVIGNLSHCQFETAVIKKLEINYST
jgi:hypothetical protein